jgi:Conjugal transfer protein TraD
VRKVRDYDAELKALSDKARLIKARKVEQLGALVTATGADALDAETLAGVLLDALESSDATAKEAWASKGAAFFQRRARKTVGGVGDKRTGDDEERGGAATG